MTPAPFPEPTGTRSQPRARGGLRSRMRSRRRSCAWPPRTAGAKPPDRLSAARRSAQASSRMNIEDGYSMVETPVCSEPVSGHKSRIRSENMGKSPDAAIQEQRDGPVPAPYTGSSARVSPGLITGDLRDTSRELPVGQNLAPGDCGPIPRATRKPQRRRDEDLNDFSYDEYRERRTYRACEKSRFTITIFPGKLLRVAF
jgi:hypothetical protein